ncbi:hypothetical protein ACWD4T_53850, partial [Streptomyces umbrinus]
MPRESDSVQGTEQAVPTVADAPMSEALFRAARVHRLVAGNLLRDTGLYTGSARRASGSWWTTPWRWSASPTPT